MIKRTLYFGNHCYLKRKEDQLVVDYPKGESKSVPIEDIGIVILDSGKITITQALLSSLVENNAAILSCDGSHLPLGLMLPTHAHHAYTENVNMQLEASLPLRKNLWQQTIKQKIKNQAILLEHLGIDTQKMEHWASQVKSGDPGNHEARAAAFYWDNIFSTMDSFRRHRFGNPPNNLLNYGYAVLRAVIARSLVASGLLTAIGIHHKNKYNPYCLADDIMEPYRPFVDLRVLQIIKEDEEIDELTTSIKRKLLIIPAIDIVIDKKSSPLMVGAQRTTASLMKCFSGEAKKILYPDLLMNGDEF